MPAAPVFGTPLSDPVERRAAYALIRSEDGRFLAVESGGRLFLPGGECRPGESPEETVVREVEEETAHTLAGREHRWTAVQHFVAQGVAYRMTADFFVATLGAPIPSLPEHPSQWVEAHDPEVPWYHECHRWAVLQALE